MLKFLIAVGLAALLGAGLLYAQLYWDAKIPGLEALISDHAPRPGSELQKKKSLRAVSGRDGGLKHDRYALDDNTWNLAKRSAVTIGRRGKLSGNALGLYRDVVSRAERACRLRNVEACWHRTQLAESARDANSRKWRQRTRIFGAEFARRCQGSTGECGRVKEILNVIQKP